MPDKPETWALIAAWFSQHEPVLYAAGMSVVIAVLRVIYGGGTRRQMTIEGVLCGALTLSIVPALEFFGLPQSMATFAGGMVGFLGVEKLRALADRYMSGRADQA